MKKVLLSVLLLVSSATFAADEVKELPPLDPAYMGVHPMVLFTYGSSIYASHLPRYSKPHNVQILYKMENKSLALLQTVRDSKFITIKPKAFNLQRLMRGEEVAVDVELYDGHYNKGGMLVYENMQLTFNKKLYVRSFDDIQPSGRLQEYDMVTLSGTNRIFIHRIQQAPSYEHILGIDLESSCASRFNASSAVPKQTELQYKFLNCGTLTPLYFETEDFIATAN